MCGLAFVTFSYMCGEFQLGLAEIPVVDCGTGRRIKWSPILSKANKWLNILKKYLLDYFAIYPKKVNIGKLGLC